MLQLVNLNMGKFILAQKNRKETGSTIAKKVKQW